jgi:hypothetical protein
MIPRMQRTSGTVESSYRGLRALIVVVITT